MSASGEKEKQVVVWESENSRCLQKLNKAICPFPITAAWMNGNNILEAILNHHLSSYNHKILLFMDNVGCHPDELYGIFSTIKICFFPANTTSTLQPSDVGSIIQNFKVHYRRYSLRYVVSKIDECESASDVVKSVNITIRLVAMAWSQVKADTAIKCFRKFVWTGG
jgi:hypothetical protein